MYKLAKGIEELLATYNQKGVGMQDLGISISSLSAEHQDRHIQNIAALNRGMRSSEKPELGLIDANVTWVEYNNPLTPPEYFNFGNRECAQRFADFVNNRADNRFSVTFLVPPSHE